MHAAALYGAYGEFSFLAAFPSLLSLRLSLVLNLESLLLSPLRTLAKALPLYWLLWPSDTFHPLTCYHHNFFALLFYFLSH